MKNLKLIGISISSVLVVIVLCVFMVNGVQNKAISLEEQVRVAYSDINVQFIT